MSDPSKYQREFNKVNLSMSVERTYTSYFRNCIILFSLGLTLISLNKSKNNNKFILALMVILCGIVLGFISVKEYYQRIDLINKEKYEEFAPKPSNTIYIVSTILIVFSVLFIVRMMTMNEEYQLF
tara:strand:- start:561 stop:938 length:378 start_codon:yes stop_codon:yes gene_type:complete